MRTHCQCEFCMIILVVSRFFSIDFAIASSTIVHDKHADLLMCRCDTRPRFMLQSWESLHGAINGTTCVCSSFCAVCSFAHLLQVACILQQSGFSTVYAQLGAMLFLQCRL